MKKIFVLVLVMIIALALVGGCKDTYKPGSKNPGSGTNSGEAKKGSISMEIESNIKQGTTLDDLNVIDKSGSGKDTLKDSLGGFDPSKWSSAQDMAR